MGAYPYSEIVRQPIGRYEIELGKLLTEHGPSPYSIVHMRPFACCMAFVEGKLAFVKQFRYSVSSWQLELPAGGIQDGEAPSVAAVRELREETGLVARGVFDLGMVYTSVGSTDEECHIFAMSCEANRLPLDLDTGEQTELVLLSRGEIEAMMDDGTLVYPPLYVAWLKLQRMGLLEAMFMSH